MIEADQALQAARDAEPDDQNWTNTEAGQAAASAGARADAHARLAEQFSTGPVPEIEAVRPFFDLIAEKNHALSEAYGQLQQNLRSAPSAAAAEEVWRTREDEDGDLVQAVGTYNTQIEKLLREGGDDLERAEVEFGTPLESLPDCSAAWGHLD